MGGGKQFTMSQIFGKQYDKNYKPKKAPKVNMDVLGRMLTHTESHNRVVIRKEAEKGWKQVEKLKKRKREGYSEDAEKSKKYDKERAKHEKKRAKKMKKSMKAASSEKEGWLQLQAMDEFEKKHLTPTVPPGDPNYAMQMKIIDRRKRELVESGSAMSVLGEDYGAKGGKPKGGKSRVNPLTGEAIDVAPSFNSDELAARKRQRETGNGSSMWGDSSDGSTSDSDAKEKRKKKKSGKSKKKKKSKSKKKEKKKSKKR